MTVNASLPAAQRHRVNPGWTIHRTLIDAAKEGAKRRKFPSPASYVAWLISQDTGVPLPPEPISGRRRMGKVPRQKK